MTIENIRVSKLKLLDKNPRKITKEKIEKLCDSLRDDPDFLFKRPILVNVVDGKHIVYAGNQRVRAAKKLGWKEIPCIVDAELDEKVMKARTIKDNKSSGDWDYDILANEYDLEDLIEWGFEMKEFDLEGPSDVIEPEDNKEEEQEDNSCPNCGYQLKN